MITKHRRLGSQCPRLLLNQRCFYVSCGLLCNEPSELRSRLLVDSTSCPYRMCRGDLEPLWAHKNGKVLPVVWILQSPFRMSKTEANQVILRRLRTSAVYLNYNKSPPRTSRGGLRVGACDVRLVTSSAAARPLFSSRQSRNTWGLSQYR